MQANEFCFWLRGYFNISGSKSLDATQAVLVRQELQQVRHADSSDAYSKFCLWLEGIFNAKDDPTVVTQANVDKMIDKLAQVFGKAPPSSNPPRGRVEERLLC